jgi:hypothetical protein
MLPMPLKIVQKMVKTAACHLPEGTVKLSETFARAVHLEASKEGKYYQ